MHKEVKRRGCDTQEHVASIISFQLKSLMSFHSSLLFACFVCYSHWFLLLYSLCGEVSYHHQVLDLLRSQLFLWKLSTAACAKAPILLERVRLTSLYTRLPCKKKKDIILISCCCLQEWETWTESISGNYAHTNFFFFFFVLVMLIL